MGALRHHLLRHGRLALALVALALLMRLAVPSGWMLAATPHGMTVTLCSGTGPMPVAMPGMDHGRHGKSHGGGGQPDKAEPGCAFAGLTLASVGGAAPALLLLAIAHVLAAGLRPRRAPPALRVPLRPPLRGPPIHA